MKFTTKEISHVIFIREFSCKFKTIEELLSMESLKKQTTGADVFENIFDCLKNYNIQ